MSAESENALFCEECNELECVHCHDFNAETVQEVDEHARTFPELTVAPERKMAMSAGPAMSSEYVDKLRAAASLLRERASKAPSGPWQAEAMIVTRPYDSGDSCVGVFGYPDDGFMNPYQNGKDTTAWVAMMSPVVAQPLACVLELIADGAESGQVQNGDFHALALAEALLSNGRTGESG